MANFLSHYGLEFSVNQWTIFYTLPSKIFSLRKYKRSHLRIFNLKYILSLMTFRIILKFSVELILGKCSTLPFLVLSSSTFFLFQTYIFPYFMLSLRCSSASSPRSVFQIRTSVLSFYNTHLWIWFYISNKNTLLLRASSF